MKFNNNVVVCAIIGLAVFGVIFGFWLDRPITPNFTDYQQSNDRKAAFISYFLPLIERQNEQVLLQRDKIIKAREQRDNISWLTRVKVRRLAKSYGMDQFDSDQDDDWIALLSLVDSIPPSLALAQAANESGWGTSRFATTGNNYFGQWCYKKGCGMIPSNRGSGQRHEVAVFSSPEKSIASYIHNLNTHRAYHSFREMRSSLVDKSQPVSGLALAEGLKSYSQRGDEYIQELQSMIRFNKLSEFDNKKAR